MRITGLAWCCAFMLFIIIGTTRTPPAAVPAAMLPVPHMHRLAPCQYLLLDAQVRCAPHVIFASSMPRRNPFTVNRTIPQPRTLACSRTERFCTTLEANSPPCCARLQFQLLTHVAEVAERHGVEFVLAQGTALAALRTIPGGFLPWDRDSDIYYRYNKERVDAFAAEIRAQGFRLAPLRGSAHASQLVDPAVFYRQHADEVGWYRDSDFVFYGKELDWRRAEGKTPDSLEVHKIYVDFYGRGNYSVQPPLTVSDTEDRLHRVLDALQSTVPARSRRATESRMRVRVTAFGEDASFPVQTCAEVEAYFESMYRFQRSTNDSRSSIWSPFPPFMPKEQLEFLGYARMLEGRCWVDAYRATNDD